MEPSHLNPFRVVIRSCIFDDDDTPIRLVIRRDNFVVWFICDRSCKMRCLFGDSRCDALIHRPDRCLLCSSRGVRVDIDGTTTVRTDKIERDRCIDNNGTRSVRIISGCKTERLNGDVNLKSESRSREGGSTCHLCRTSNRICRVNLDFFGGIGNEIIQIRLQMIDILWG